MNESDAAKAARALLARVAKTIALRAQDETADCLGLCPVCFAAPELMRVPGGNRYGVCRRCGVFWYESWDSGSARARDAEEEATRRENEKLLCTLRGVEAYFFLRMTHADGPEREIDDDLPF